MKGYEGSSVAIEAETYGKAKYYFKYLMFWSGDHVVPYTEIRAKIDRTAKPKNGSS